MNILIVSDLYPPEIASASFLMQELAEGLQKRGHQITVVTPFPRYYLNSEVRNENFKAFSVENNIEVIRIKTLPLHKVNFVMRGISQLLLPLLFLKKIKKLVKRKIEAVIVYTPPLTLGLVGSEVKKTYGAKFILNIQDMFPQNAIDLGILKNPLTIKFFEWLEKKIYKSADKITFHSEGGRQFLIKKKGIHSEKIITLHNWIDPRPYQNLIKNISFRKQYGLGGKFIFLFAGIMGPAQGLEFLIKVAKEVSDIKDTVFLLVGDGMEKEKIQKMVKYYSLTNVIIKPFVSKEKYPYLLNNVDVGTVCLSEKNKTPFIPGKFLGYLAAARPIIAFLNQESDGFDLVQRAKCGYAVNWGNLKEAADVIRKMRKEKDKLKQMGENGLNYLLHNFTIDASLRKIEGLLEK